MDFVQGQQQPQLNVESILGTNLHQLNNISYKRSLFIKTPLLDVGLLTVARVSY
jgi:hypothetical protein